MKPPGEKACGPGQIFLIGGDAMPDLALEICRSRGLHLPKCEEVIERIFRRVHGRWRGVIWRRGQHRS